MRTIKFRGYDNREKKWFYGLVVEIYARSAIIRPSDTHGSVVVSTKTVGQYTGLKDKTGREIYEGDILSDGEDEYDVCFWNGSFCLNKATEYEELSMLIMKDYKIVGNIYGA